MRKISRRLFCVGFLFTFLACGFSDVYADAWVVITPKFDQARAIAAVPGQLVITGPVVVPAPGLAQAGALAANANSIAAAVASAGNGVGIVTALAGGQAAFAGPENPFVNPLEVHVGPGNASLSFAVSFTSPNMLTITGTAAFNANGFLELAVLDLSGLAPDSLASLLSDFGSIERAVASNAISMDRVLFINREGSLLQNGSFTTTINIGSIDPGNIAVTGLAHAVSDVPEPATMVLLGTGLAGFALKARKRRASRRT